MKTALAAAALCATVSGAAAETMLHLSETATVTVAPDRLVAVVRAEAAADSAASAQDQVNGLIREAVALAKAASGIAVATEQYNVWRLEPKNGAPSQWRASQSILLHGQDGPTLLQLAGALQQHGLAVESLGWELAPETARSARTEAENRALKALRGRADGIADAVGLQFDGYRSLTVGSAPPGAFRARTLAAASLAAQSEPSAEAEDVRVDATVEADNGLKPR